MKKIKSGVRFLYYVQNGVCKSNEQMPSTGAAFKGWLSAASVIRNQSKHTNADVKASIKALHQFIEMLKVKSDKQNNCELVIEESDLLKYI